MAYVFGAWQGIIQYTYDGRVGPLCALASTHLPQSDLTQKDLTISHACDILTDEKDASPLVARLAKVFRLDLRLEAGYDDGSTVDTTYQGNLQPLLNVEIEGNRGCLGG